MVKEIKKENKTFYVCEECEFAYLDKELAEKCEVWCKERHSCNMEITKHAVKID